jgi:uncharacterized RDD family membrane protein YckC
MVKRSVKRSLKEVDMEKSADGTEVQKIPVVGFGRRLAAALIDSLIILFFAFTLSLVVILLWGYFNTYTSNEAIPVEWVVVVCGLILSFLYYVGFWSKSGQTIAKSVLGITVVGSNGKPLSVGKAILRYFGYIISALPLSLGFLWIAFDKKYQGWHDKIASSYAMDGDADIFYDKSIDFVPADSKSGRIWIAIWLIFVMVAPAALLSSLFILGPTLGRIIINLIKN